METFAAMLKRKGAIDETKEYTRIAWLKQVHYQGRNSFCIAKFETKETQNVFVAKGNFQPDLNSAYEVTGNFKWEQDFSTYQFIITSIKKLELYNTNGLVQYLVKEAPDIGEVKAKALAEAFGKDTLATLEADPVKVVNTVKGIALGHAMALQSWAITNNKESAVKADLYSVGLTTGQVNKFMEFFGKDAANKVRTECFNLIQVDGIGFLTCCKIADKLGVPRNDPLRIQEGIKYAMNQLMQEKGHVSIPWHDLVGETVELLDIDKSFVIEQVKKMHEDGLICKDTDDPAKFSKFPKLFEELARASS